VQAVGNGRAYFGLGVVQLATGGVAITLTDDNQHRLVALDQPRYHLQPSPSSPSPSNNSTLTGQTHQRASMTSSSSVHTLATAECAGTSDPTRRQVSGRSGHPIQTAECRAHSPCMRNCRRDASSAVASVADNNSELMWCYQREGEEVAGKQGEASGESERDVPGDRYRGGRARSEVLSWPVCAVPVYCVGGTAVGVSATSCRFSGIASRRAGGSYLLAARRFIMGCPTLRPCMGSAAVAHRSGSHRRECGRSENATAVAAQCQRHTSRTGV
jgi:hypothetical protein